MASYKKQLNKEALLTVGFSILHGGIFLPTISASKTSAHIDIF